VKLKSIIQEYQAENIYNGDKTGLFFRALSSKTLSMKSEKYRGAKPSKELLTIF